MGKKQSNAQRKDGITNFALRAKNRHCVQRVHGGDDDDAD